MMRSPALHRLAIGLLGAMLACAAVGSFAFTRKAVPPTVGVESPALSTVLVALGGARGVVSELLWWRIYELQNDNRYAELLPLTELLLALDPSTPGVWTYQAWNLAYNIAGAHVAAEERWHWIKTALQILNRGLEIHRQDPEILREMGWIYENKVADTSQIDRASRYYRAHLSEVPPSEVPETLTAALGFAPDLSDALQRALVCYTAAGHTRNELRVLRLLVRPPRNDTRFLPYYRAFLTAHWEDLSPQEQEIERHWLSTLRETTP